MTSEGYAFVQRVRAVIVPDGFKNNLFFVVVVNPSGTNPSFANGEPSAAKRRNLAAMWRGKTLSGIVIAMY